MQEHEANRVAAVDGGGIHARGAMNPDRTPIKVRGKRTGTKLEKWHAGKVRKHMGSASTSRSTLAHTSCANSVVPAGCKRKHAHLSRLEQLPTEMVQAIFVYSGNLDLPLTSSSLANQLSGNQLQWELTESLLGMIVDRGDDVAVSRLDLTSAERVLNSNFMTWRFFRRWLDSYGTRSEHSFEPPASPSANATRASAESSHYADIWTSLKPAPGFTPPLKALRGPWSADRIALLRVFAFKEGGCSTPLYGVPAEIAYDGLTLAVEQHSLEAIQLFRGLRMQPDQKLLRKAVVDYACDRDIVLYLLQWCVTEIMRWSAGPVNPEAFYPRLEVDFLDPVLWQWAEKAKTAGDSTGEWLTKTLKRVSGVIASDDTQGSDGLDGVPTYTYR